VNQVQHLDFIYFILFGLTNKEFEFIGSNLDKREKINLKLIINICH